MWDAKEVGESTEQGDAKGGGKWTVGVGDGGGGGEEGGKRADMNGKKGGGAGGEGEDE